MKVKLLLSSLLLGGVVGVYGSGTELPGHNEADAEQNDGSVPSLGKEVNAAVSTEVVCSNEHLYAHPHPQVRALGDIADSVVYADDSRLEIVRINISKDLGKDDTYKLWDALSVIINKPDDVGVRCRLEPGFLQIQSVDLRRLYSNTLESPAPQTEVMDYRPLFQILRLAIINTIEIKVQSDAALDQLMQILSTHGSLKELSICDIADAQLLSRIGGVFKQNPHLRKLSLEAIPRTFREVLEADSTTGRKVFTHYSSHQVVIDPQLFRHLTELRELTFVNLAFMQVGLINILRQIRSLQEFTYSEPNLDNKVAISIRALADDLGLNIDLGSSSPKRLNGYDNSTRKNVVDKLFYPSTSQELLGKYKGNKEISIK